MSVDQKLRDILNSSSEFEMLNDDFEVVAAKRQKAKNAASTKNETSNEVDNHENVILIVRRTCPVMKRLVSSFNNIKNIFKLFLTFEFFLCFLACIAFCFLVVLVGTRATSNRETISCLSNIEKVLPEEASERFLKTYGKHRELKDEDIFDEEFHCQEKTEKMTRDECIRYLLKKDWSGNDWLPHTAVFTDDGFLKIKFYKEKKMSAYHLAKPNKNIEGGYKLYELVYL